VKQLTRLGTPSTRCYEIEIAPEFILSSRETSEVSPAILCLVFCVQGFSPLRTLRGELLGADARASPPGFSNISIVHTPRASSHTPEVAGTTCT
jgi:hypothetical protein